MEFMLAVHVPAPALAPARTVEWSLMGMGAALLGALGPALGVMGVSVREDTRGPGTACAPARASVTTIGGALLAGTAIGTLVYPPVERTPVLDATALAGVLVGGLLMTGAAVRAGAALL